MQAMVAAPSFLTAAARQPARQRPTLSCRAQLSGFPQQRPMSQGARAGAGAPSPSSCSSDGDSSPAECTSQAAEAQPAAQGAPQPGYLAALLVVSWRPAARAALLLAALVVPPMVAWLMWPAASQFLVHSGQEAVKWELFRGKTVS